MKLKIYTDWWSRGNPGNAGIWVFIIDEAGEEIEKRYKNIWKATNNVAEYSGAYYGIKRGIELWAKEVEYFTDSKLVVHQLKWEWKIKNEYLRQLHSEINYLLKKSGIKIEFNWIPREQNKEADRLSNVAMDEKK